MTPPESTKITDGRPKFWGAVYRLENVISCTKKTKI